MATYYPYEGSDPICGLNSSGQMTAINTFGADGLISRDDSIATYYTYDERGNVAQRLSRTGQVLSSDLYNAYGTRTSTAAQPDPFGYGAQAGYYTDAETGLCLLTHRYYDPKQGRFLTRDPAGYGGGINLYSYTQNNPGNGMDPSGNFAVAIVFGAPIATLGSVALGVGGIAIAGIGAGYILGNEIAYYEVPDGPDGFPADPSEVSFIQNIRKVDRGSKKIDRSDLADEPDELGKVGYFGGRESEKDLIERILGEEGVPKDERQRLHNAISKQGYTEDYIRQLARDFLADRKKGSEKFDGNRGGGRKCQ